MLVRVEHAWFVGVDIARAVEIDAPVLRGGATTPASVWGELASIGGEERGRMRRQKRVASLKGHRAARDVKT